MKEILKKLLILNSIVVWSMIAVGCAKSPKAQLIVSKNQIKQGESVSVEWNTKNAKEVLLNGKTVAKAGTQVELPTDTITYEIVGKSGKKEAKDKKTVTVEVIAANPTITFSANPGEISVDGQALLRWSSQHADKVDIPGLGTFGPSGETKVSPTVSTTYTATAKGSGGEASASAYVNVKVKKIIEKLDDDILHKDNGFSDNIKSIYFDFDKSDLREDAKLTLDNNAKFLTQDENHTIVFRVEGDCDPHGSEEYNLALGDRRANAAKTYLIGKGIDPSRINVISNGKRYAVGTAEGDPSIAPSWAHDRRAEFINTRGSSKTAKPESSANNK